MIFTSYTRDHQDYKQRKESAFEFLYKSAWKISEFARQAINGWITDYDCDEEFLKMFKSKSDKQHYSAVFELLTYVFLRRLNFIVTRHPQLKTNKKPDFEAKLDEEKFYIECTLSANSYESLAEKNKKDTVEEIIEDIRYFPYWINVDFLSISDASVSKSKLLHFLNDKRILSEGISNEELFTIKHHFEDNGWELEISLLRKTTPDIKRSLGYISQDAKIIETSKPILNSLNDKKASRYGITTEPYILFLNTSDMFGGNDSVLKALYGRYRNDQVQMQNNTQAFYLAFGRPINTSVSAVVVFRKFDLFTLDQSSATIWYNPFAKNKIPPHLFPIDEYISNATHDIVDLKFTPHTYDLLQILGIDRNEYLSSKVKSS